MTTTHLHEHIESGGEDWLVKTAPFERFVQAAKQVRTDLASDVPRLLAEMEAPFQELLADQTWLPNVYAEACLTGGRGGGIGQWLLYRGEDHGLVVFSLVVPPGSATPVHDHHAWGLVG